MLLRDTPPFLELSPPILPTSPFLWENCEPPSPSLGKFRKFKSLFIKEAGDSNYDDINNFIKCLTLKAFIINEVTKTTKIASFFVFLYEIYFLFGHFYFKCHLKNPRWYSIKQERTFYYERFSLKITSIVKGLKYYKFMQKRYKNMLLKRIILKGNITTKYIEH